MVVEKNAQIAERFFDNHYKGEGIEPGEWENKLTNFIDHAL